MESRKAAAVPFPGNDSPFFERDEPEPSLSLCPSSAETQDVAHLAGTAEFDLAPPVRFTRDVDQYKVLWAVNPFEFYLIKASDEINCFNLSGGFEALQGAARILELDSAEPPKQLIRNKIYVILDNKRTNNWHRCRLLDFNKSSGIGEVYYFDGYRKVEKVALKNLRETPREIVGHPIAQVYRCHLYDVIPKDGSRVWDDKTLEWFSSQLLVNQGIWRGLQMSWNEKRVGGYEGADLLIDVGMILFEDTHHPWDGISVNFKLVRFGKAQSIGIGGTYFSSLFFNDSEPMFSLHGVPKIHLPESEWFEKQFPYYAGSRLPQIDFVHLCRLDCIYVSLVNKHKDLKAMEYFMESQMEPSNKLPRDQLSVGTPILCWNVPDKNDQTRRCVRGVVIHIFEEDEALVLQVDTGKNFVLNIDEMYVMPKRLVKIPAFVHRIHLTKLHPVSGKGNVIPAHADIRGILKPLFEDLIVGLKKLVCFAVRSNPATNEDIVPLHRINENLFYFPDQLKWQPALSTDARSLVLKQQPLLDNYFYSFGVDIKIVNRSMDDDENDVDVQEIWKLASLSELISKKTKMLQLISETEVDKKKYYQDILNNYSL